MPKCSNTDCKKTAYYGTIFQLPTVCKDHSKPGLINVKKKCERCNNAALSEHCVRCTAVYNEIERYKTQKLNELIIQIENESKSAVIINAEKEVVPPKPHRSPTPGKTLKKNAN